MYFYRSEERGLSRKHIIESVKASLQRLQLQYIDIVIIHKADAMCPMEGTISLEKKNKNIFLKFKISLTPTHSSSFVYAPTLTRTHTYRNCTCHELCHPTRLGHVLGHSPLVPSGNYGGLHKLPSVQLYHSDCGTI